MALVLLTGGARSGKSRLAVDLGATQGAPVVFLATAEESDEEMAGRVAAHREERPADWRTIEEPLELEAAIARVDKAACVIVDCLSLWTANAMRAMPPERVEQEAARAAALAARRAGATIAVTNEVGMGVVPATPLGRAYRDVLGRVNAAWAAAAARAILVVAGRAIELEPAEGLIERLGR